MFWNKKTENQRFNEITFDISKLKIEMKELKEQIEKLEIKALEVKKLYHKKLNELYGENESKEKDIYKGVLLPE
jgi:hypothetical protein